VEHELAGVAETAGTADASSALPGSPAGGEAVHPPPSEALVDEIGDLLFAVVNLARKVRIQPAVALDRANAKFRRRFARIEQLAAERGIDVATAGLEALDALWEETKRGEGRD
jgi:uncharacterized protein YabN with tetrapyrrole methylase and pyrophosphatase domain